MKIDFESDLVTIARNQLQECEIPHAFHSDESILLRFFSLHHRMIEQRRYQLHLSQVAELKLIESSRLNPSLFKGICRLLSTAQNGGPLWPHQSKGLLSNKPQRTNLTEKKKKKKKTPAHLDMLFSDWGIQHLHLGLGRDPKGFVSRTSDLVFAFIRSEKLHLIDIRPHGNWDDISLLEIVDRSWPHLLESFVPKGVAAVSSSFDMTHKDARRHGLTIFSTLSSGKVLFPPGGGYATSGDSIPAITRMDQTRYAVRELENHLKNNEGLFRNVLSARLPLHASLHFRLILDPQFEVVEMTSRTKLLGPESQRLPSLFGL